MSEDATPRLHLVKLDRAVQMLGECKTAMEVKDIKDKATALATYLHEKGAGIEAQNKAIEIILIAGRRMVEFLHDEPKATGGEHGGRKAKLDGSRVVPSNPTPTLADQGISKKESSLSQKLALIPKSEFDARIDAAKVRAEKLTVSSVLAPTAASDHDGDEWMTPAEYVERARRVLGKIHLDPASSERANEIVKAKKFFTKELDGLKLEWKGNVWLNPPFSSPLVGQFVTTLIESLELQDVPSAILLTNNATETEWFQNALDFAGLCCLPDHRIAFLGASGKPMAQNRQAQAFFFFNCDHDLVLREFGDIGTIVAKVR